MRSFGESRDYYRGAVEICAYFAEIAGEAGDDAAACLAISLATAAARRIVELDAFPEEIEII